MGVWPSTIGSELSLVLWQREGWLLASADSSLPTWLEQLLQNSPLGSVVGTFVALAGALTFLSTQTETIQKLIESWRTIAGFFRSPTQSNPPIDTTENRRRFLRVLKSEIARRRQDSLHNLVVIDLMLQDQPEQVGRLQLPELAIPQESQVERTLQIGNQPAVAIANVRTLFDVFNQVDIDGKLLILGKPGSGKTTEILKFAAELIDRAEADATAALPVILELSSWRDEGTPIAHWMIGQLKKQYNVPLPVAQQWLQDEQLVLLLDGLNELGLVQQVKCIRAINQFLAETAYPHFIVCCREEEYQAGEAKLSRLNGAIYLQPLTDTQIYQYLQQVNRISLWDNIQHSGELMELARIPLLLTMMVAVYQGRTIRKPQELFDLYIEQRFSQAIVKAQYPAGKEPSRSQTRQYLIWLARQLKAQSKPELLIERIQPSWLGRPRARLWYRLSCGVIIGLLYLMITWLVLWQLGFGSAGRVFGVMVAGMVGFLYGVYSREDLHHWLLQFKVLQPLIELLDNEEIEPIQLGWSWERARSGTIAGSMIGLLLGTIVIVFFSYKDFLVKGLVWGLSFAGSYGLLIGLVSGLQAGIHTSNEPNQGMRESARNALTMFLIGVPMGMILATIGLFLPTSQVDLYLNFWLGMGCGLFSAVLTGGLPCIQHFVLRVLLWRSGMMPWNYARFLNYAHDLRLMQRVGGRYRFIHELLREHFAQMRS
ncbi:NACHT domain-containing protein [Alkalinema pantanalense CENA528]|uniref:NACHT domain-containing protein n=1 Tax=Alkalinema pantanalense TaxID=1620705 RepID=UPI003D6F175F